jgi:D-3-phosphoglycerate dehydrogenase / 2-oxoglutarate reductase
MSVNLPGVVLPQVSGTHRLSHIHRNVPGVLATINGVLAEHKVNVEAQLLGTRGEYGYVVTDIAAVVTDDVFDQLRRLPETVRLRVLD